MQTNYIKARRSNLYLYQTVPLYYRANGDRFGVYKPSGMNLKEMRVKENLIPNELYLKKTDKAKGTRDVQKVFNKQLQCDLESNNLENAKKTVVNLVDEMFSEPSSGILKGLSNTVNIFVGDFINDPEVIKNFWHLSDKDYTTALHSVNVMALAIRYAISRNFNKTDTKLLGLCALLHDVGKTKTDNDILTATRKLSDEEFAKIKFHPIQGYNLLKRCKFSTPEVKLTALEHHEKLDGSGYPNGSTHISEFARTISILDCFEALTNDDRPYRDSMIPYKALDLIQKDVIDGKLDKDIYAKFIYSLG
jgi:putative nucleotidyltransferase with HDIG domain